ncbi:MAG: serine protease [Saprospiraceae bacterium]
MTQQEIYDHYKDTVIEIATPFSLGTGLYISEYDIIITKEHVVRGNKLVVVTGSSFSKQLIQVVYLDTYHDLAFLAAPKDHHIKGNVPMIHPIYNINDEVFTVTHLKEIKKDVHYGKITGYFLKDEGLTYIVHDTRLTAGDNGSPLFSADGQIIGLNTFESKAGMMAGYALPFDRILDDLKIFKASSADIAVKCPNCKNIIMDQGHNGGDKCPQCDVSVHMIHQIADFRPLGMTKTIEDMIERLEFSKSLSRRGPNNWSISYGGGEINISFYEKTGLIIGDAYLCDLPDESERDILEYILRENYGLESMTMSIADQKIMLSLLIYEQFLNTDIMYKLFGNLLHTADQYERTLRGKITPTITHFK